MVVDAMIRAAAVGGVASMWSYFTLKILKICEKIIFPPGEIYQCDCVEYKVCEVCGERYVDDQELETRYGDEKSNN